VSVGGAGVGRAGLLITVLLVTAGSATGATQEGRSEPGFAYDGRIGTAFGFGGERLLLAAREAGFTGHRTEAVPGLLGLR
jgi:hypothetical protein